MKKDYKKLRELRKQAQLNKKGLGENNIPTTVANIPNELREHYGDKYRLIFEYYNHNRCELANLHKTDMKQVINLFSRVTKHDQTTISKLCRPDPVKRTTSGSYASLFNGLPEDFDTLMEIDFTGSGRIFVHLTGHMCCVIAVAGVHKK